MAVKRKIADRRLDRRNALWPDAEGLVFQPGGGGWARIPRTVPMIASLIDLLGGKEKAGRLYVALWAHEYGDGFVEVQDPAQVAFEAGYMTGRAERTFDERVALLEKLGFLRAATNGVRAHGFLLLLDPHVVVRQLRVDDPTRVPKTWWRAFEARCAAVGIVLDPAMPPGTAEQTPGR
jgi:hypothetical protein